MPEKIKAVTFFGRAAYKNLFAQIPALAEDDYFLQFNGYELLLPQRKIQDALNIFELSVLKFQALGNFSARDLSDKLCLKTDLIDFIFVRLTELGLLDDAHRITDAGREFLGEKTSAAETFEPYLLLVTRDTGEIFPNFIPLTKQLQGELNNYNVEVLVGSTGTATLIKGGVVFVKEKVRRENILSQEKIRDALTKFNRRTDEKIFVDAATHIQSTFTQPIFLHVKAVLQSGNVDYLVVSDGEHSHSDFLREVLERNERNNSRALMRLKTSVERFTQRQEKTSAPDKEKYPEIRKLLEKKSSKAANLDEAERVTENEKQHVENLSKAIEWALFYHLKKFPPPPQLISAFCSPPQDNFRMLMDFAERLDLSGAAGCPKFFESVTGSAVKNFSTTENPTIVPLLALNLATAARVADSNFLNALETLPGNPFEFLQRLDGYGKSLRHENEWSPRKNETAAYLHEKVLNFVRALLPDFDNPAAVTADPSNVSVQKINAQLAVIEKLGEENFLQLSPDLQTLLLKISPDKSGSLLPPPVEFVTTLSKILEKVLRNKLTQVPEEISVPKSEIVARLKKIGSTSLRSVNEKFYLSACKKQPATLGAYALAFMAASDENFQTFTAAKLHELVSDVAKLRGHTNNLSLSVSADDLSNLRDDVFNAIKILGA